MRVNGGQQRNNQQTKGSAKADGGGGSNSDSNSSGENGNGNGNATAPVMDSNGQCNGTINGAGDSWHNDNATMMRRKLTARQHLQYME